MPRALLVVYMKCGKMKTLSREDLELEEMRVEIPLTYKLLRSVPTEIQEAAFPILEMAVSPDVRYENATHLAIRWICCRWIAEVGTRRLCYGPGRIQEA